MKVSKLTGLATCFLLGAFIIAGCNAAPKGIPLAKAGTLLRKIQDRGRIIVGVKYDIPSFGYLNKHYGRVEGFEPAIAREIAAYIFGDPNKIEFKEALTKDREARLQDGTFDLVLATYVINEERLKAVDFSVVYYQSAPRLLVNQDSPIKSISDVDGEKLGTIAGSDYIPQLAKITKVSVVQVDNNQSALVELSQRNLDAFVANDFAAYGLSQDNPTLKVLGAAFSSDSFGVGVAKGHPELLQVVNTVIWNLKSSGKWKAIWKWEIGDKFGIGTIPEPPPDNWM